ncbi:hypothetical protein MHC_02815 [Mycoplasma haemocanis str. Illinois]|uniref:Uncharacterized protein n=1 Tax=Mycoplasma haemocanis (strain Illinois) TaxID=1111676 RepID=H6N703_MYCHN|nr:hypothetical protein [Mycoplasma haemocanis]AEW45425.1 hypothetical protein MHC_02815 [Mycoplasma haemocanis str. Illinois]
MKYWLPVSGTILLSGTTALTLSSEYPNYTKSLEVYFYTKKQERIKVWIEDLENLSKVQYYDSNSSSWKKLFREQGDKYKRYSFLFSIASYYIQIQHWINIVKHLEWLGNKGNNFTTTNSLCCNKQGSSCSSDDIKDQKRFSLYLTNLSSSRGDVYFSPVQVHIKLSDTEDFEKILDEEGEKSLSGSMVYGFVDYYYKPLDSDLGKDFYKDINSHEIDHENKKYYYANYPQLFKFKHDKVKLVEGSATNLFNIHKELKNKKNLLNKYRVAASSSSCNDISCIINKNFVQKSESLDSIRDSVKNSSSCNSSQ